MAESAGPFDSAAFTEDSWAAMARLFASSAVEAGAGGALAVSVVSGFNTQVASGNAFVRGFGYANSAAKTLTHAGAPSTSGTSRLDLVVLHLDRTANSIDARILTGVASATPSPPALTQNDATGIWEIALAQVTVAFGASGVGTIVDTRLYYDATDTGWTQSGMTAGSGFALGTVAVTSYRKVGRRVDVRAQCAYSGANITNPSNAGNITDTPVLVLPTAVRPPQNVFGIWSTNGTSGMFYVSNGTGECRLADMYSGQIFASGQSAFFNISYWLD